MSHCLFIVRLSEVPLFYKVIEGVTSRPPTRPNTGVAATATNWGIPRLFSEHHSLPGCRHCDLALFRLLTPGKRSCVITMHKIRCSVRHRAKIRHDAIETPRTPARLRRTDTFAVQHRQSRVKPSRAIIGSRWRVPAHELLGHVVVGAQTI